MQRIVFRVGLVLLGLVLLGAAAPVGDAPGAAPSVGRWQPATVLSSVLSTVLFGGIGIVMAIIGFKLFDVAVPFKLETEICEKQNMAVAVLCGFMILGISIVVAAAVI